MKSSVTLLAVLALTGGLGMTACSKKSSSEKSSKTSENLKILDPDGCYNPRSDESITKHPPDGFLIKCGNVIEFNYDGSKGDGLNYMLYYIDDDGHVHPMTSSNFENKGNGVFSRDITIFNSSAHQRPGFMEVNTVEGAGFKDGKLTGKTVSLGMYPVHFEATE